MTKHNLIKGTGLIAVLTSISRVLGFIRDITVAAVFGAGPLTDVFFVALRIPNLLRSMVAEGALTSAFVPVFMQELKLAPQRASVLFRNMSGLLICLTGGLTILGITYSPQIVAVFAPGFQSDPRLFAMSVTLTQIMFPFLIFISLVALINGALNSYGVYGAAPIAQIVMNICLVIGALITLSFDRVSGIYILAWSVFFSGIAQVAVQIPALRKVQLNLLPLWPYLQTSTQQILKLMVPAIFGAAVYQLTMLLNTMLASLLPQGSISWLFYADRLSQLPVGILVVSLGSVLLPSLSGNWAIGDKQGYQKSLTDSLRFTSFLIIPVALILIILAEPLCDLLFERGQFSTFDSFKTAQALIASSIGLWGISMAYLLMRAFLSTKDTVTPTLLGFLTLTLSMLISLTLMGRIESNNTGVIAGLIATIQDYCYLASYGHTALALSAGMAATLLVPLTFYLVEKKSQINIPLWPLLKTTCILLFASAINLAVFTQLNELTSNEWYHLPWQVGLILAIFYLTAKCTGLTELAETSQLLKQKFAELRQ